MADVTGNPKLPGTFKAFVSKFPELGAAHEGVARACVAAGPMDKKMCELVKIGISLGAGLESALKSHVRRAMEAGATEAEVEQAIILGMNTVGFPRTVMGWSWAREQFARDAKGGADDVAGRRE
jgi:alkylhydroperoxidase/carboxymuconolactone decarboxylase family protein YurZ